MSICGLFGFLAKQLLAAGEEQIEATLATGGLTEVHCDEDLQK